MDSTLSPALTDDDPTLLPPGGTAERGNARPRYFGDHELLEEIARGGMGVVYRARQVSLNRIVALKMILGGHHASQEEVQRFRVEARAAANLQHPNIVAIYDVDEIDGQHFFSMEFVPGKNLSKRMGDDVLPGKLAAHYALQIARGIQYAHDRGILHRDLKPANILLDDHDVPKITDFGLAKILAGSGAAVTAPLLRSSAGELTHTGAVMGTPSYMAPEQAAGSKELGPACDVYGIGAILYELLTGKPPFKAESSIETILQVLNQCPAPPRLLNPNVDPNVETICMKCLEKDPRLRYGTAQALADDLQRFLNDDPITARSANLFERLTRTLSHSQHDKELRSWGLGLMLFALITFCAHLAGTILLETDQPRALAFWGPRLIQFGLIGLVLWYFRPHSMWPTNAVERLIWAAWIGYLVAYVAICLVMTELGHDHREVYPVATVLSGLAFFVMGCHVWGGCYVIGLLFMLVGPLFARHADSNWSPFWFGTLWGLALTTIGLRYWRMSLHHSERV